MSARSQLGDVVYRNHERPETYLQRVERSLSPVETVFHLDVADRKTQFVAGSLGCGKALSRVAYEHAFGASIDTDFGELLERLRHAELIEDDGARVVLTEPGKLVYDRVLLCFYPERAKRWLRDWAAAAEGSPQRAATVTRPLALLEAVRALRSKDGMDLAPELGAIHELSRASDKESYVIRQHVVRLASYYTQKKLTGIIAPLPTDPKPRGDG